jgi:quinol monooxygenase YgiN
MVITVLEAQVAPEKASLLEATYKEAIEHLDAGIVQTCLIQNSKDTAIWQIVTYWENSEALDAMRQTGGTPRGVLIFRTADAEPQLTVFKVAAYAKV